MPTPNTVALELTAVEMTWLDDKSVIHRLLGFYSPYRARTVFATAKAIIQKWFCCPLRRLACPTAA
jgi:hypothetical protein